MVRGTHTLKFGVEVRRIQLDQGNSANGTLVYSSLSLPAGSFLVNSVSSATFNDPLPLNGLRKTEVYSYAQDEWKFRPNLTLNLGLRYDILQHLSRSPRQSHSVRLRHLRGSGLLWRREPASATPTRSTSIRAFHLHGRLRLSETAKP